MLVDHFFKNKFTIFLHILFLVLALIALRGIFSSPGIIGYTWDWDIPPFPGQIVTKMQTFFSAWYDIPTLGITIKMASPMYFWILIAPFSFLGGAVITKVAVVFTMVLAASSMFFLCRELDFNCYMSSMPSMFYMFSPVMYSRLVAGHLPVAFGYALLPLFVAFLLKSFKGSPFRYIYIIIAGILFSVVCEHPMLMGCALIVLLVLSIMEVFSTAQKLYIAKVFFAIIGVFIFLHSFWLIPFFIKYIEGEQVSHGGLTYALGQITLQAEIPLRVKYLQSCSVSLIDSMRLLARQGLDVEFVFFNNNFLPLLWTLVSFFIPILVFSTSLFKPRKRDRRYFSFILVALLGIALVSGVKTPIGTFIYHQIFRRLSWVFGEFSNANRWNPLVAFSYAVLLGFFFQEILTRIFGKKLFLLALIPVLLYTYPFWSGNLSRRILPGSQPLSLLVTKINLQDEKVYNFLKNHPADFRVSYLPPATLSYVGEPKLSYEWTSFYSPKPEFMGQVTAGEPFSQFCVATLFQQKLKSEYLGKVLGLAGVKYIIFPYYEAYFTYLPVDGLELASEAEECVYDTGGRLENTMNSQKDILGSSELAQLDTIRLYENKSWLPHIYPARSLAVLSGDFSGLVSMSFVDSLEFSQRGLIFSSMVGDRDILTIRKLADEYVLVNNNYIDMIVPYLPDQYKVHPGHFCVQQTDANQGWVNLGFYWYHDWYCSSSPNKRNGIFTLNQSICELPYLIKKTGTYDVYVLVRKGPRGSRLDFYADDFKINSVATKSDSDLGFKWVYVDRVRLPSGGHTFRIKSDDGENAVLEMIIAPQGVVKRAFSAFRNHLADKKVILLNEIEQFKEAKVDRSASQGFAVTPPVDAKIYSPKEGKYKISLRASCPQKARLVAAINETQKVTLVESSDSAYKWYAIGDVFLNKGVNRLLLSSDASELNLDLILMESSGKVPLRPLSGGPRNFKYIKINPTKYKIHVDTSSPFFLFFSERFSPKWQAHIGADTIASMPGYGFGNLYYINKTGDFSMVLEYADQKYFRLGQLITFLSWITLLAFLIVFYIRIRKINLE